MPVWGRRESYPMVVTTVAILSVLFGLMAVCRPLIPPADENDLAYSTGDYVRAASRHSVRWRTLAADPFLEARRLDRPLLLAIGSAGSWISRNADRMMFGEPEVAERLNREFVCVRIDTDLNPEWTRAVLPVTSVNAGADPGWSVVIADPSGVPLVWLARTNPMSGQDAAALLGALMEVRSQMLKEKSRLATMSEQERRVLLEPGGDTGMTPEEYVARLALRASNAHGGFPENGIQRWHPWEWRFMLLGGLSSDVAQSVGPLLRGPKVNWIDGGLFVSSDRPDGGVVRFDGSATLNADMAAVLAWLSVKSGSPWHRLHAERLIDAVLDDFLTSDGLYAWSYLSSSEGQPGRRYEVSPRSAASRVGAQDRRLVDQLGLRSPKNESRVPYVATPATYLDNSAAFDRVFASLRRTAKEEEKLAARNYLHVTGAVVARLFEAARWLGDSARLRRVESLLPLVRVYEVGSDDVTHSLEAGAGRVTLGDYTAFADAMLQGYLATGDQEALDRGRATLDRGRFLFYDPRHHVVLNGLSREGDLSAPLTAIPQLADGDREATTASFIRLSALYSQLEKGSAPERIRQAREVISKAARSAKAFEFRLGGFYHAVGLIVGDFSIAVSGPNCVEDAAGLARLVPGILVFPTCPSARSDLNKQGVYFLKAGEVEGPITMAQARARLAVAP